MTKDRAQPRNTPWGRPNSVRVIAEGIVFYETPSHGGFWLSPERVTTMPPALRDFVPFAGANWYEEDCDWAIVALAFPQFFSTDQQQQAARSIQRWKPELHARLTA
jgi:hypothetical protein